MQDINIFNNNYWINSRTLVLGVGLYCYVDMYSSDDLKPNTGPFHMRHLFPIFAVIPLSTDVLS